MSISVIEAYDQNYWSIFPRQVSEANEDVKVEAKICAPKYPMECSSLKLRDDGLTGKNMGKTLFLGQLTL